MSDRVARWVAELRLARGGGHETVSHTNALKENTLQQIVRFGTVLASRRGKRETRRGAESYRITSAPTGWDIDDPGYSRFHRPEKLL